MNKNMLIAGIVVVVIIAVGAIALQQKPSSSTNIPVPKISENQVVDQQATESMVKKEGEVMSGSVAVTLQNFSYSPKTLTVKKGTIVTWTNEDSVKHNVVSDTGSELDGPLIGKGETFNHTFDTVGSFAYHCQPHPNMKATVEVVE